MLPFEYGDGCLASDENTLLPFATEFPEAKTENRLLLRNLLSEHNVHLPYLVLFLEVYLLYLLFIFDEVHHVLLGVTEVWALQDSFRFIFFTLLKQPLWFVIGTFYPLYVLIRLLTVRCRFDGLLYLRLRLLRLEH